MGIIMGGIIALGAAVPHGVVVAVVGMVIIIPQGVDVIMGCDCCCAEDDAADAAAATGGVVLLLLAESLLAAAVVVVFCEASFVMAGAGDAIIMPGGIPQQGIMCGCGCG